MGYRPGPRFGAMLKHLLEKQLDGEVDSAEEAEAFIHSEYPLRPPQKKESP